MEILQQLRTTAAQLKHRYEKLAGILDQMGQVYALSQSQITPGQKQQLILAETVLIANYNSESVVMQQLSTRMAELQQQVNRTN